MSDLQIIYLNTRQCGMIPYDFVLSVNWAWTFISFHNLWHLTSFLCKQSLLRIGIVHLWGVKNTNFKSRKYKDCSHRILHKINFHNKGKQYFSHQAFIISLLAKQNCNVSMSITENVCSHLHVAISASLESSSGFTFNKRFAFKMLKMLLF